MSYWVASSLAVMDSATSFWALPSLSKDTNPANSRSIGRPPPVSLVLPGIKPFCDSESNAVMTFDPSSRSQTWKTHSRPASCQAHRPPQRQTPCFSLYLLCFSSLFGLPVGIVSPYQPCLVIHPKSRRNTNSCYRNVTKYPWTATTHGEMPDRIGLSTVQWRHACTVAWSSARNAPRAPAPHANPLPRQAYEWRHCVAEHEG